jgi:TonB family protein
MQAYWAIALFVGLGTSFSGGQQATSAPSSQADAQPARVKVYAAGPGVTAPELLPANPAPIPDEKCKRKQKADGIVMLSVIVDATGHPRNLMFFHPAGSDLDKLALQIAGADRFKPGTSDGAPVAVAQLLDVILQACVNEKNDDAGRKTYRMQLRSLPIQRLSPLPQHTDIPEEIGLTLPDAGIAKAGGRVRPPILLNNAEAVFTDAARKAKYQGICILSLIVDAQGMPQNVRVVRPLDYGLVGNAIDAVKKYRFKPAMKDGIPVPIMVTVEVNFRLY